jgi:hypothetical protein
MGIVSSTVRNEGGDVIGVMPYAMVAAGGEGEKTLGSTSTSAGAGTDELVRGFVLEKGCFAMSIDLIHRSSWAPCTNAKRGWPTDHAPSLAYLGALVHLKRSVRST